MTRIKKITVFLLCCTILLVTSCVTTTELTLPNSSRVQSEFVNESSQVSSQAKRTAEIKYLYPSIVQHKVLGNDFAVMVEHIDQNTLYCRQYDPYLIVFDVEGSIAEMKIVPEGWRFIRPCDGRLVFDTKTSLAVTDSSLNLIETIPYPKKLCEAIEENYSDLPLVVSDDLNILMRAEESGEEVVREEGVMLYDLKNSTSELVLPKDEYYYYLSFINDGKAVFASRFPNPYTQGVRREFLIHSIADDKDIVIGNNHEIGELLGLSLPYILFEKGYYDTQAKNFFPINLPNYTMTPDGGIYYIKDSELYEYYYNTGLSEKIELIDANPILNFQWEQTNTLNHLVIRISTDDSPSYPSGYYAIKLDD